MCELRTETFQEVAEAAGAARGVARLGRRRGRRQRLRGRRDEPGRRLRAVATQIVQRGNQCLMVLPTPDVLDRALLAIRAHGGMLISVTPQKGSLEELFTHLAGETERTSNAEHIIDNVA